MTKEIEKITIRFKEGRRLSFYENREKIVITKSSISYEKKTKFLPLLPPDELQPNEESLTPKKWSYKTTNKKFEEIFIEFAKETEFWVLNNKEFASCYDDGDIYEFKITYNSGTELKGFHITASNYFKDQFELLQKLVPSFEEMPEAISF